MSASHVIGTITLNQTTVFRNLYETASNYTDVQCDPQTVDLTLNERYGLGMRFHGIIVGSLFVNRVFTASAIRKDADLGKPDSHFKHPYPYELYRYMENPLYTVTLAPDTFYAVENRMIGVGENYEFISRSSRIVPNWTGEDGDL